MDYLPSKKFFYILFGIVFMVSSLIAFKTLLNSEVPKTNSGQVEVVAGNSTQPIVPLWLENDTSTSTLIAKAMYYDNLLESTSTEIAQAAVDALAQEGDLDKAKILGDVYKISSIKTTDDNSPEAVKKYGNDLQAIMANARTDAPTMSELDIIKQGIGNNDLASLSKLDEYIDYYQKVIQASLRLTVPSGMAALHLAVINALSTMLMTDMGYRNYEQDQVMASAAFFSLPESSNKLIKAFTNVALYLKSKNIVYSQQEGGYMFNYFLIKQK